MMFRFHQVVTFGLIALLARPAFSATVGAYYYPWWGTSAGGHTFEETLRDRLSAPEQLPLIGEYDNRDLWTTAAHIDQSQAANISMWSLSWWGPNSFENAAIRDYILPNPLASRLSYTVHYESTGRLGSFSSPSYDNLVPDFRHLADNVFSDPNYMRIDGRPVVVMYLSRVYFDDPAGWAALDNLRTTMQAEYGYDPYIIGDHFFNTLAAGASELDAVTAFDTYGQTFRNGVSPNRVALLANRYASASANAAQMGVDFVPGISPGYNDRGVRLSANNPAAQRYFDGENPTTAGSVFSAVINDAALPTLDPDAHELMLINSFNEWHEDTQIEATGVSGFTNVDDSPSGLDYTQGKFYEGYGSKYLDILRTQTGGPDSYAIYNGVYGDVNQDGSLNGSDAVAFRAAWGSEYGANTPLRQIAGHGDWNLDGTTDLADALKMSQVLRDAGTTVSLEQLTPSLLLNGGFESPNLDLTNGGNAITDGWDSTPDVPGWTSDANADNSGIQPDGPFAAGTPEGDQVAYLLNSDPSVYQTTSHLISGGEDFVLQFAAASYTQTGTLEASIYYFDGLDRQLMETISVTHTDAVDPLVNDAWNVYSLTASAADFQAAHGYPIGVEFNSLVGIPSIDGVVLTVSSASLTGDFDGNGLFECSDIDALVAEIAAGTHAATFDLTGDGLVDASDLTTWLALAGEANLGPGVSYLAGDANLDGQVDGQDFIVWNNDKFTSNAAWCAGDFNADGQIDGQDFVIWNQFKFTSSDVMAVPEPDALMFLLLGMPLLARGRRWMPRDAAHGHGQDASEF
ncbi:MAG: DUF5010 domain-containing protein [Planctomycetota bacterium]